jgi:alpha-tubulin suppressor-like RCC1 family protein
MGRTQGVFVAAWFTLLASVALSGQASGSPGLARQPVSQITARGNHTCELTGSQDIWCWGENDHGQLGNDSTDDSRVRVRVATEYNQFVEIEAGLDFNCALRLDARVECWGGNAYGQLGDGTTAEHHVGVAVQGLDHVAAISAGAYHACALLSSGQVRCWGNNTFGELGRGSAGGYATIPGAVAGITGDTVALSLGYNHSCALRNDGAVLCWGRNADGQLGNGSNADSAIPVPVALDARAAALAAGAYHTCVLTRHGAARCFGYNGDGELGDGSLMSRNAPVAVSGLDAGLVAIAGGSSHTCVLDHDHHARCWGENSEGELGNGGYTDSPLPTLVTDNGAAGGAPRISYGISAGGIAHTCSIDRFGAAECWGRHHEGQLGNGANDLVGGATPAPVLGNARLDVASIAAGEDHACALTVEGKLKCWGDNDHGQVGDGSTTAPLYPIDVLGFGLVTEDHHAVSVAGGQFHSCAATSDGEVHCWGDNGSGQLGNGTTTPSPIAVPVSGLDDAVAVAAGIGHSCALRESGQVSCWGNNVFGELGDGSTTTSLIPVAARDLSTAIAIAAGGFHSCALLADHGVRCWGDNTHGELGDGTTTNRTAPVSVVGLGTATQVATGQRHSCALLDTGVVKCWGQGTALGDAAGTTSAVPVAVTGITTATAIAAAGGLHTCALLSDETVRCWGYNADGQLGDDGDEINSLVPVPVLLLSSVSAIAAGYSQSCAIRSTGTIYCWGSNSDGQLGLGYASAVVPVPRQVTFHGQFLDFDPPSSIGGAPRPIPLEASASSGNLVFFDTWTPDTCSVVDRTVTVLTAAGVCGIRATGPGSDDYINAPRIRVLVPIGDAVFEDGFE